MRYHTKKDHMYSFSQSITPAARSHFDSQVAFFNDLSKSLSSSFRSLCEANFKLGQTMLEESMLAGQRMLTTGRPGEAIQAATAGVQPASDKLRAYQQHISRLAADAQVDLARVTQQHSQETSRTAHALADEVSRVAAEATDRNVRQQEETLKNFRDPFQQKGPQGGNGSAQTKAGAQDTGAGVNMQADVSAHGQAGDVSFRGSTQGQPAQQSGNRSPR
jgi:phasin family protein